MIQLFSLAKRNPQVTKSVQQSTKTIRQPEVQQPMKDEANHGLEPIANKRQKLETDELSQENEKLKDLFYSTKKEINDFYETQKTVQDDFKKFINDTKNDQKA